MWLLVKPNEAKCISDFNTYPKTTDAQISSLSLITLNFGKLTDYPNENFEGSYAVSTYSRRSSFKKLKLENSLIEVINKLKTVLPGDPLSPE